MRTVAITALVAAALGAGAADLYAQTDAEARAAIIQGARLGDRITVTLRDGGVMRGRLVDVRDTLTVRHDGEQRRFTFDEVDRVTRRKNGFILGPIIGTAAGVATGVPFRSYLNNEGRDGNAALAICVVSGLAIGTLLDALIASDETIYRRPDATRTTFTIAPARGGVSALLTKTW